MGRQAAPLPAIALGVVVNDPRDGSIRMGVVRPNGVPHFLTGFLAAADRGDLDVLRDGAVVRTDHGVRVGIKYSGPYCDLVTRAIDYRADLFYEATAIREDVLRNFGRLPYRVQRQRELDAVNWDAVRGWSPPRTPDRCRWCNQRTCDCASFMQALE